MLNLMFYTAKVVESASVGLGAGKFEGRSFPSYDIENAQLTGSMLQWEMDGSVGNISTMISTSLARNAAPHG